MFTRARIYGGETYLKNHLSANDYYAEGEKVTGRWVGKGAELLHLVGDVESEAFESLRKNEMPGCNEKLTPRTKDTREPTIKEAKAAFLKKHGRDGSSQEVENFRLAMKQVPNRVAFYDYQCSAQKSVSIMAGVLGDHRLRHAHEDAVKLAFAELEQFASRQQNTQTSRHWEMTGNLCAAVFTHDASRALDPQLHTHFVIANATYSPAGRWYALEEYHIYKAVRYAGKVYQNAMARAVQELGYAIREVRDKGEVTGFEIEGVPDELCERYSKRREEIEKEIEAFEEKHGREPTPAEISVIARATRDVKLAEISTPEVMAMQRAELTDEEFNRLRMVKETAIQKAGRYQFVGNEAQAVRASVAHLFERSSVFKEHEILTEALNQDLGGIRLDTLKAAFAEESALIKLTDEPALQSECATVEGLAQERWSVEFVNATKERCVPLNPHFIPERSLSEEQRNAVRAILNTKDQVFAFRGVAGSGKTTTLSEVQRGLVDKTVYYLAPTADAVKVLKSEGFRNATTVEDFLQNVSRRVWLRNAVVICDEAGLQSNRQGAALLYLAEQHRMRVLLVGDARQHVSVEGGDFLRVLETHSELGRCEVVEIRRQQSPEYKEAISLMAHGNARGGLQKLDALGWLHERKADYLHAAASDYLKLVFSGQDDVLVVAPTWKENDALTEIIRERLKLTGTLNRNETVMRVFNPTRWTAQQKRNFKNYLPGQVVVFNSKVSGWKTGEYFTVIRTDGKSVMVRDEFGNERALPLHASKSFEVGSFRDIDVVPGDKILIRANRKKLGLINGQVLTARSVKADGTIETKEGITIPTNFKEWCHGYVATSHKSQGRTCEHVIVAAERLDSKAAYVACSRGRQSCTIHTLDKARLLHQLTEGNRQAALDVIEDHATQNIPSSLLNRGTVWLMLKIAIVSVHEVIKRWLTRHQQQEQIHRGIRIN